MEKLHRKRYNLRKRAAHSSRNATKDKDMPAEFISPKRKEGDDRINTDRMAYDQFWLLLQALVEKKPIPNIQTLIFTGTEGEDILSWLKKFELTVANNKQTEEKQGLPIPLYLDKSALFYYNLLPEQTKANQQLVNETLRMQDHSPSKQWQLRSEL